MSASYHRQPVKAQLVDSLMFGEPPTLEHMHALLVKASTEAGWAAWTISANPEAGFSTPDNEMLDDAEEAIFKAYLAIYAYRGRKPS